MFRLTKEERSLVVTNGGVAIRMTIRSRRVVRKYEKASTATLRSNKELKSEWQKQRLPEHENMRLISLSTSLAQATSYLGYAKGVTCGARLIYPTSNYMHISSTYIPR